MANRRMFSKRITTEADRFLDLSHEAQLLYFHFGLQADDDGFVGSPNRLIRVLDCKAESINQLNNIGYIMIMESGVIYITHWLEHNNIKKDRYNPTIYQAEFKMLLEKGIILNKETEKSLKENSKSHRNDADADVIDDDDVDTEWIQNGTTDKVRVVKARQGEASVGEASQGKANSGEVKFVSGKEREFVRGEEKPKPEQISKAMQSILASYSNFINDDLSDVNRDYLNKLVTEFEIKPDFIQEVIKLASKQGVKEFNLFQKIFSEQINNGITTVEQLRESSKLEQ